jgi:serine protease Do
MLQELPMKKLLIALAILLSLFAVAGFPSSGVGVATVSASDGDRDALRLPSVAALDQDMQALLARIGPAYVLFSAGSGVCISADGYVLTNHHVAPEGARRYLADANESEVVLPVQFPGGKSYSARPVGADPRGDIVLVKLDLEEGETVPFVELGDSDAIQIGDIAVAIGNPFLLAGFAYEPSVSVGVISATNRAQGGYTRTIQTDAALNPGNSGGPLFDIQGRLIGINGRILTSHGMRFNTGAGFAIPINQIKLFIERFKDDTDRGLIVRHGLVAGLAMRHDNRLFGAAVLRVRSDSLAAAAGLRSGDVVTHVNGHSVRGVAGYYNLVSSHPQYSTVRFTITREEPSGKSSSFDVDLVLEVPVTLNQSPEFPTAEPPVENSFIYEGLQRGMMSRIADSANPFGVANSRAALGVRMVEVEDTRLSMRGLEVTDIGTTVPNPSAAKQLRVGDLVLRAGGRRVTYISDLRDVMLGFRSGEKLPMRVLRGGQEIEVEVDLVRTGSSNTGRRGRR